MSDRREEDQRWRVLAVVLLAGHSVDRFSKIFAKRIESRFTLESFVVAEETEDDVGLILGEPLIGISKVVFARPQFEFIARKCQIPNRQIILGKQRVKVSFQPAMMLHPISKSVADPGDVIPFSQLQLWFGGLAISR